MQTNTQDPLPDTPLPPTPHSPIERPSPLRHVFFGTDGLRAGWSMLIFIALFAAFLFLANFITHKIHPPTHHTSPDHTIPFYFMFLNEAVPLFGVGIITWIMSKVERRPIGVYGLGGASKLPHFVAGLAWGIICLTPFILILWKAGFLVFDNRLLFGSDILRYGAQWLALFFAVGLLEEYFTRGYLQYTLTRGLAGLFRSAFKTLHSNVLAFWTSAVIFSTFFGLIHGSNPGESPIGLLTAGIASMMFCLVLWRTGSLWWAVGFHTTWDWGQSFLYGVADSGIMVQHHLLATHPVGKPLLSGGTTGPEGSVVILPIIILIIAVIVFTLPRTNAGYTRLLEPPVESQDGVIRGAGLE
ncbi:CPBP family intramembrane glutamic endopeptidase [Tunturiibacter gelidoferens]|uniref:CPBP family intramembrane metalloprotease n=1 Tax=Tunturiibacter gelidiferens TaxID=3069689 RepID=A0AAU7YZG2_9BACT